jgi:hypothetical protein
VRKSKQYKRGAQGYYYILRSKHGDVDKDFWVVAHETHMKNNWHRHVRYICSGGYTQETMATCFFHAVYSEKEERYAVREVSGIGSCNNYVTIGLL